MLLKDTVNCWRKQGSARISSYIEQNMVPEFMIPGDVPDAGVYEEQLCWEKQRAEVAASATLFFVSAFLLRKGRI